MSADSTRDESGLVAQAPLQPAGPMVNGAPITHADETASVRQLSVNETLAREILQEELETAKAQAALLADTEARLAEALNRLCWREAEVAALPQATGSGRALSEARDAKARKLIGAQAGDADIRELKARLEKAAKARNAARLEARTRHRLAEERRLKVGELKERVRALSESLDAARLETRTRHRLAEERRLKVGELKERVRALSESLDAARLEARDQSRLAKARRLKVGELKERVRALSKSLAAERKVNRKLHRELDQVRSTRLWRFRQLVVALGRALRTFLSRPSRLWQKPKNKNARLLRQSERLTASDTEPDSRKYIDRPRAVAHAEVAQLLPEPARAASPPDTSGPRVAGDVRSYRDTAEPALAAADVLSLAPRPREETTWVRHAVLSRHERKATLELRGMILGWFPQEMLTPSKEACLLPPSFDAAALFCRMMRIGERDALRCFEGDAERTLKPAESGSPSAAYLPRATGSNGIDIADIWFVNARDLRLRFVGPSPVLRFFQWDARAERLILLAENRVESESGFADVPTFNPFLPILVAASDPAGALNGIFVLPFPSLCRGGAHYGELVARESGGGLMQDLHAFSASLAEAWLASEGAAFTIGRIDVDLAEARGSELIFSRVLRVWLDACFDLQCRAVNASAIANEKVRLYLEETLGSPRERAVALPSGREPSREQTGSCALQLGVTGIPSLQAIVSRGTRQIGQGQRRLGASILVRAATGMPQWVVDAARLDADLLELQPRGPCCYPTLSPLPAGKTGARGGNLPAVIVDFPLAIRFCETGKGVDARLIAPFASDKLAPPPARSIPELAAPAISVLCPFVGEEHRLAAFLDSLKLQNAISDLELIVAVPSAQLGTSLESVHRFFPNGQVISCQQEAHPGARINLMAERARGELLLIASGVMLHDPNTLTMLSRLARRDRVATAGCVLIGAADPKSGDLVRMRCGGFCPDSKADRGSAISAFARLDSPMLLPRAVYPIGVNPPPLFMTRHALWRKLDGFNETLSGVDETALDYAIRASIQGYANFCTSAVTASVIDEEIASVPREIAVPSVTPPLSWHEAASHSVLVRRLVA